MTVKLYMYKTVYFKNMEDFWLQWNSTFSKRSTSLPNINGLFDNDDIANVFCDTLSASQYDSYSDSVKFGDCLNKVRNKIVCDTSPVSTCLFDVENI